MVAENKDAIADADIFRSVWNYLSQEEENETNWEIKDDLRIAKLCILQCEAGNPDPWRYAFWLYMGCTPERYQGIRTEREAYKKLLGPTPADQLQDPLFLATLEPLARPFYWDPQIKLDLSRDEENEAILNTIEAEGAGDAKAVAAYLKRRKGRGLRKAA